MSALTLYCSDAIELTGDFIQGGLIVGRCKIPLERVSIDGQSLQIADSTFVFGFDLDESLHHTFVATFQNGTRIQSNFKIDDYNQGEISEITVDPKMIEAPVDPELIKRLEKEYNLKQAARKALNDTSSKLFSVIQRPVVGGRVSTNFGAKRVYNDWKESVHTGVDIAKGAGVNVRAMADGIVTLRGDYYYSGNFVFIDHGLGLSSEYFHLSRFKVKQGDRVTRNQIVGEVGSTGRSTGPHLHWQTYWFKKRLNPLFLIDDNSETKSLTVISR
jgi:murein DD-endopeptidase MepM/ murein hydrolase activator NlpD